MCLGGCSSGDQAVAGGTPAPAGVTQTPAPPLDAVALLRAMSPTDREQAYAEDVEVVQSRVARLQAFLDRMPAALQQQRSGGLRSFYEPPRVALFRHGFQVADWSRPQGPWRFTDGIDLLNTPFQWLGAPEDVQHVAIATGIADTAIEQQIAR